MKDFNETEKRILKAALDLFLHIGIKKTTIEDIAQQSGLTRITIYRYFKNKEELVKTALLSTIMSFENLVEDSDKLNDIEEILDRLSHLVESLPKGDIISHNDEMKKLYPDFYDHYNKTRYEIFTGIFRLIYKKAKNQNILREEINEEISQILFMEAISNIFNHPRLIAMNISSREIYENLKKVFLYGIIKT